MTTTETIGVWGRCSVCGSLSRRYPGERHGDGQVDTDENPVWLLDTHGDNDEMPGRLEALAADETPIVDMTEYCCG